MATYEIEKRGRKSMVVEINGEERKDLQPFTGRAAAELFIKKLVEGKEPQTPPSEPPKQEKKISGSDFVMRHLIINPEATIEELRKALDEAGLKMAQGTLETWPPFMKKVFKFQDEAGWKRPEPSADEKAEAVTAAPAEAGDEATE